jgi:hypothetical protein
MQNRLAPKEIVNALLAKAKSSNFSATVEENAAENKKPSTFMEVESDEMELEPQPKVFAGLSKDKFSKEFALSEKFGKMSLERLANFKQKPIDSLSAKIKIGSATAPPRSILMEAAQTVTANVSENKDSVKQQQQQEKQQEKTTDSESKEAEKRRHLFAKLRAISGKIFESLDKRLVLNEISEEFSDQVQEHFSSFYAKQCNFKTVAIFPEEQKLVEERDLLAWDFKLRKRLSAFFLARSASAFRVVCRLAKLDSLEASALPLVAVKIESHGTYVLTEHVACSLVPNFPVNFDPATAEFVRASVVKQMKILEDGRLAVSPEKMAMQHLLLFESGGGVVFSPIVLQPLEDTIPDWKERVAAYLQLVFPALADEKSKTEPKAFRDIEVQAASESHLRRLLHKNLQNRSLLASKFSVECCVEMLSAALKQSSSQSLLISTEEITKDFSIVADRLTWARQMRLCANLALARSEVFTL